MKSANKFDPIFDRIKKALGARTDTDVAKSLGIKPSSIAGARKREKIPPGWIETMAFDHKVSSDWLWFGVGEMAVGDKPLDGGVHEGVNLSGLPVVVEEFRELQSENRELNRKCQSLLRENGDLRVEVVELKSKWAASLEK